AAGGGEFVSREARGAIRAVVDAQQSGLLGEVVRAGDEDVAVAKAGNAESDGVGVGDAEGAVEAAAAGDGGDGGEGGGGRGGVIDVDVEGGDGVGGDEVAGGVGDLIGDEMDDIGAVVAGVECAAGGGDAVGGGDGGGVER